MADFESALSELGAALAATDTKLSTSLAEILGVAIQELIEAELTALIGAGHGERTPTRTSQRNGHRPKLLSTPAGDIGVGIPKLRAGSFFPELLEPRRRIDKALVDQGPEQTSWTGTDEFRSLAPSVSMTSFPRRWSYSMSLHPYLFFTGTCRQAMIRYHEILGGHLEVLSVADMPEGAVPPPGPPDPDLVIHAALVFGDGDLLMASDDPTGDGAGMRGMAVNLTVGDAREAARVFGAFAEGGEVSMPLAETFWSPCFGMCTDRFGTSWMVNVEGAEVQA